MGCSRPGTPGFSLMGRPTSRLNTYLFSGSLVGWRQPKLLYQLKDSASKYVFRIPDKDTNNT